MRSRSVMDFIFLYPGERIKLLAYSHIELHHCDWSVFCDVATKQYCCLKLKSHLWCCNPVRQGLLWFNFSTAFLRHLSSSVSMKLHRPNFVSKTAFQHFSYCLCRSDFNKHVQPFDVIFFGLSATLIIRCIYKIRTLIGNFNRHCKIYLLTCKGHCISHWCFYTSSLQW